MKKLKNPLKKTIEVNTSDFLYLVELSKKKKEYTSMRAIVEELVQFHREHTNEKVS